VYFKSETAAVDVMTKKIGKVIINIKQEHVRHLKQKQQSISIG